MFKYELGLHARDKVSGFEGIITSRTEFITGCPYYGIQPKVGKDGKLAEANSFDETRLEILKSGHVKLDAEPAPARSRADKGGPHDMPRVSRG